MQASKSYMALKVFHEMRSQKCKPNICTFTALVNAFAREGLCEKAEEIFEQLQEAGLEPDVYAYNALMEAYRLISNTVLSSLVSGVSQWQCSHLDAFFQNWPSALEIIQKYV